MVQKTAESLFILTMYVKVNFKKVYITKEWNPCRHQIIKYQPLFTTVSEE